MDRKQLETLGQSAIDDLLWRRLRLAEPLDPPLDRRFRMEAPEELFIIAWQQSGAGSAFSRRLVTAIRHNLGRVIQTTAGTGLNAADNEQLASLAFLADAIEATELSPDYYRAALYAEVAQGVADQTRFHLLRTLARMQQGGGLVPFWQQTWASPQSTIRAIAYYGLSRAAPQRALDLLPEVLADEQLDLPPIAWHLLTDGSGASALGKAARQLSKDDRRRLRTALVEAGAEDAVLRPYDRQVTEAGSDFQFAVPPPPNPQAANHPQGWGYGGELRQAA